MDWEEQLPFLGYVSLDTRVAFSNTHNMFDRNNAYFGAICYNLLNECLSVLPDSNIITPQQLFEEFADKMDKLGSEHGTRGTWTCCTVHSLSTLEASLRYCQHRTCTCR